MSLADWQSAGAALAPLDDITVLLLVGDTPAALAGAARRAASAAGLGRRVAVFDLAGAFGLGDPDGLVAAFREGRSLNALARPMDASGTDQFIVPRGPGAINADLATHERWPRLIEGFRSTGALLIVTARGNFAGMSDFAALAERGYRVVERDGTVLLLDLNAPTASTPAPAPAPPQPAEPKWTVAPPVDLPVGRRPKGAWRWTAVGVAAVIVATGAWTMLGRRPHPKPSVTLHADSLAALDATPAPPVTVALPAVVNLRDSARAARWGVELVATNDRTDANFRLAEHGALPAGTVSPVLLGGDAAPWYKIVAGAFVDRTAAEHLRAELRRVGTLDSEAGVVSQVPYALRLDTALSPAIAKVRAAVYVQRGVAAYALLDDDGRATIYAGAFATPEQTVVLIATLHSAGIMPALVFRVGRTY